MIRILYDGDCPVCAAYTSYARLKDRHGDVDLRNAREEPQLVAEYARMGHDIDETFIVDIDGHILTHGAAMAYINAQLAPRWTGLGLVANPTLLKAAYPAFRAGRNALLKVLGRSPIGTPPA